MLYNKHMSEETTRNERMTLLREQGYSYGRIAKIYRISRQRVHQLVSKYDKCQKSLQRPNGWYRKIHESIIARDRRCIKCDSVDMLVVHHIDGNDNNNDWDNLVTFCAKCHLELHRPPIGYSDRQLDLQKRNEAIVRFHKEGATYRELNKIFGLSPMQIMRIIRRSNEASES